MSDGSVRDIIHWPEENESENFEQTHGGIPILFPFAARTFHEGKQDFWKDIDGIVKYSNLNCYMEMASVGWFITEASKVS